MNNIRRIFYYPAVAYMVALVVIWLLSWLMGVIELVMGLNGSAHSLVSAEGVRWAVRNALNSIDAAPWGVIMLFVSLAGVLSGSGMTKSVRALMHGDTVTINERRAWLAAGIAFLIFILLIFMATVSPWNLLLGVTGNIYASPLLQGRAVILFGGVLFVAVVYGFIYGNYRSVIDVARSIGGMYALFAPALLAVLPASGILPCADYAGLLSYVHLKGEDVAVVADFLFLLPFLYVAVLLPHTGKRLG